MATLTTAEVDALQIEDFIFHVVHHGADDPILFDDTPLASFEQFFIDRIKETLKGNRFLFKANSQVKEKLESWENGEHSFVDISKNLARQFHRVGDKRMKTGVLIVIGLKTNERKLYSLIKYDSEKVVTFIREGARAILQAVTNNFTESPKALQKSALIDLKADEAEVVIIDRMNRTGISDFYKKFLGVERLRNSKEMTSDLVKAVRKTVKAHAAELPRAITSKVSDKIVEIAKARKEFEVDAFFNDFFGVKASEEIRQTFDRTLDSLKLTGEAFEYDEDELPKSEDKKYITSEGIRITMPAKAKGLLEVKHTKDESIVTIRTSRLQEI
ncbi:nucleoid-associated protein [Pseudomonas protegens]|uniref:nucleoid-associated protein n=1 Tax=Pseudomonas protegens TaxID=380021 RepID=UPI0006427BB1|nr:nucleoid-associated protein [Pseudomonas protegens]